MTCETYRMDSWLLSIQLSESNKNMKKRYVLAALVAMTVLAGCGDNASQQKNTDNTTQESTAEEDLTAADPDEDGEELDP